MSSIIIDNYEAEMLGLNESFRAFGRYNGQRVVKRTPHLLGRGDLIVKDDDNKKIVGSKTVATCVLGGVRVALIPTNNGWWVCSTTTDVLREEGII